MIAGIATILQFIIFKLLYPFADFFSDSYSYIYGAYANLDINIWPIGYSWFLRYFHFITHSDTAVVAFQYFFLILSSLIFFFTIRYFYRPARNSSNILYVFLFFNPLFLYISNYINSDPLFASLSLLWITQLLWIIHRPMIYQILTHGILLYLCFIVRNNAMIYPFISALAFLLSNHRRFVKVLGIAFGSLLVILFVNHQRNAAYKLIGQKEFSLFTGWQLANNALYARPYITIDSKALPDNNTRELDRIANDFYNRVHPQFNTYLSAYVANFFIREREAPLKVYFKQHFNPTSENEILRDWAKASVPFGEYGKYILYNYPRAYFKHFMLLNTKHYFLPPLEKLEVYNLGQDEVWKPAMEWFDYKSTKVESYSRTLQGTLLAPFPLFFLFVNVCVMGIMTLFLLRKHYRETTGAYTKSILVMFLLFLGNMAFTIFTTMNVLRYQFFPMVISFGLLILLSELIGIKKTTTEKSLSVSEPQKSLSPIQ